MNLIKDAVFILGKKFLTVIEITKKNNTYVIWFPSSICEVSEFKLTEFKDTDEFTKYVIENRKKIKEIKSINKIAYLKSYGIEPYQIKFSEETMQSYCVFIHTVEFDEINSKYLNDETYRKIVKNFISTKTDFEQKKRDFLNEVR